ncbi:LamG-like jellyroll fold domain-containing protein [Parendozoicomonas sp. Alg238-R29]|uniref:LamG-like jellyroll fold domain-containing protein n=1 Tax=Parendozoicomonas sp. Alg238-R29 TaxID=2993446 RepID=UPI00248F0C94|nr:LamG-like jellyroll fold domain-containing protein [Parendozoicomonas sp. Alg238-R29]
MANDIGSGIAVTNVNGSAVSGVTDIEGEYGTLSIETDGSFTYTADDIGLESGLLASWQFDEAVGSDEASDSSEVDLVSDTAYLHGKAEIVTGGTTGNALSLNAPDTDENSYGTLNNASLLGQYSFDSLSSGDTQITDSAGTRHGAIASNAHTPSSDSSPQGSSHIELNGSGTIDINTGISSSAEDITLAFWFKWDGDTSAVGGAFVASFGNYGLWINDGKIGFNTAYHSEMYGAVINDLDLAPASSGLANEWHHFTVTFHDGDPQQSSLRVDGIEQNLVGYDRDGGSSYSYSASNADIHQQLKLGGHGVYADEGGGFDNLQVFEGTLSNDEAVKVYETSSAFLDAGRVVIEDSQEINITSEAIEARSITFSFKPDASNTLIDKQILFEEGDGTAGFIIYIQNNTLYAGAYSKDSGWDGDFLSTSLDSIDTTEFHRITLTMDSDAGTLSAWLDGTQIGEVDTAQAVSSHNGDVSIGGMSSEDGSSSTFHDGVESGSFRYSGLIDDVKIYDRALSHIEVQSLAGESPTDSFSYQITDDDGNTATASLDISLERPTPTLAAANDAVTLLNGERHLQGSVATNDTGLNVIVTNVNSTVVSGATDITGEHGTLSIDTDGSYSYTANAVDLESDLLASWQFDEAAGSTEITDSSTTGQVTDTGTLVGDSAIVSGGVSGNALSINPSTGHSVTEGIADVPNSFSNATLLGSYNFDGLTTGSGSSNQTVTDQSGDSDGTLSGIYTIAEDSSDNSDKHLDFDDSNSARVGITTGLDSNAEDITIGFWLRLDEAGEAYGTLASFGSYELRVANGLIGFSTNNYHDLYGVHLDQLQISPDSSGLVDEWHYITATFHDGDPTQSVLRIDGVEQPLVGDSSIERNSYSVYNYAANNSAANIHQELKFGGSHNQNYRVDGALDDLQIFEGTISDGEALQLYENAGGDVFVGGVNFVDSQDINTTTEAISERTITLSFKPDENNDLTDRQILFESGGQSNGFVVYIHGNSIYAGAYSQSSGWSGDFISTSLDSIDTTEFHRITLSLDGDAGTMTAWLDGTEIGSVDTAGSVVSHGGDIAIGQTSDDNPTNTYHDGVHTGKFTYSGLIDDVRVYGRAFSGTEVKALADESPVDSFSYQITDDNGHTETASLAITIEKPLPAAPVTEDDSTTLLNSGELRSQESVLENDIGSDITVTDVEGVSVASSGSTDIQGEYGVLSIEADGDYDYTMNAVDLESDLVASWQFDEAAGSSESTDSSTVDQVTDTARLVGNAAIVSGGVSGNALSINPETSHSVTEGIADVPNSFSNATLLGSYNFDGLTTGSGSSNQTVTDQSGDSDGTLSGIYTIAEDSSDNSDKHLDFNDSNNAGVAITTGLDSNAEDITIGFWLRLDEAGAAYSTFASFGGYELRVANGLIGFSTNNYHDLYGIHLDQLQISPDSSGLVDEWHYITATFHDGDPTQSVLRIDGVEQPLVEDSSIERNSSSVYNYAANNSTANIHQELKFGGSNWYQHYRVDGALDDLQIFEGTLDKNEAFQLYENAGGELFVGGADIADSTEVNQTPAAIEERTITLAFKPDPTNDLSERQILYESGGQSNGFVVYLHNNSVYAGAYSKSSGWHGDFIGTSLASVDTTEFHRITLSLDGNAGTMTAWLDGTQIGSVDTAGSVVSHGSDAAIGKGSGENASVNTYHDGIFEGRFSYSGLIDDVRIYDRALTDTEVQVLAGENLAESFTYTVTDNDGDTAEASLSIEVETQARDLISGGSSDNTLIGTGGADTLLGGGGDDILTGGGGIDFFTWEDGDQGNSVTPAVDTVTDFTAGSDVLNLSDLLPEAAAGDLDQYLSLSTTDGTTTIDVSTTAGGPVVQKIVLDNVDLTSLYGTSDTTTLINNLTNDGNLQV